MVWALRTVFMMIPSSAWTPGGRIDPPKPLPFEAFRTDSLSLACPFAIVRQPYLPTHPRRRKIRAA